MVLLRVTFTRTINLRHNQQQSSGLHQPRRSTNYQHWLTLSQPTTVLRFTPTQMINQLQTLTLLGHNQQQSFSGIHKPGRSTNHKHTIALVNVNPQSRGVTLPSLPGQSVVLARYLTAKVTGHLTAFVQGIEKHRGKRLARPFASDRVESFFEYMYTGNESHALHFMISSHRCSLLF